MAQVVRVRRLANPRRRNAGRRVGRRKMTAKQIRHFGTRRQKAALKAARARKRRKPAAHRRRTNPVTRIVRKSVHVYRNRKRKAAKSHRRRRTNNPAPVILTLGAVNPQGKRRSMAQRKRKRVASRRRNSSRRRRTRIVVSAPHRRRNSTYTRRRRVGRRNPRRYSRRRRNPSVFGSPVGSVSTVKMVVGGLAGVAAAKFIPTLLPASIVTGNITRIIATGASALVASFVARKVGLSEQVAGAVLFGGLMQTASVAMNALLPTSIATRLALAGITDPGSASFAVPQNPLRPPMVAIPTTARTTVSGLDRAYGRAI